MNPDDRTPRPDQLARTGRAHGKAARDQRGQEQRVRPLRGTTSKDVALEAGVSQPTVSRALRGDPSVAEATRRRVVDAARRLGYIPSERGRSLSTRRTDRIGVVVEDLGNPFYFELLDALHDRLESRGLRMVVLTPARNDPERLERLLDGSIDGVVLTTTLLDSPLPRRLLERGFPFVLLNRTVDGAAADSCAVANVEAAAAVAAALAEAGHRCVGAILGPPETSTGRDRAAGFRRGLEAHGIELPAAWTRRGPFAYLTGHDAIGELLRRRSRPTAIFCANDVIALGALNGAHGLGVRIPAELSIVGFDDIAMAAWELFELTTVRQDLQAMCQTAVDLLAARIAEPEAPPRQVVLPARLVRRATLAPPPA